MRLIASGYLPTLNILGNAKNGWHNADMKTTGDSHPISISALCELLVLPSIGITFKCSTQSFCNLWCSSYLFLVPLRVT